MTEQQSFIEKIVQQVVSRLLPYLQNATVKPQPRLMDTKTAAVYLGITPNALWHLKHRLVIPCVRIKTRVMWDRVQLDSWIAQHRS
jgi:hypothetical protein